MTRPSRAYLTLELRVGEVERVAELLVDSVVRGSRRDIGLRNRVLAQLRTAANQRAPRPALAMVPA